MPPPGAARIHQARNACGAPLHVTDIELVNNANGDFSIAHAADSPHGSLPANLAPQDDADVITVDVTYQPSRAGISTGQIRVRSDDPNRREVVVDLVARSIFPCVRVTPMEVDFREVLIGSSEEFTVEVTNCGNADLEVGSVRLVEGTSPELALAAPMLDGLDDACLRDRDAVCTGRATIGGSASKTFIVRYAPTDAGADGGRILLATNVPGSGTVEVDLFGRGTSGAIPVCLAEARTYWEREWDVYPDEDYALTTIPLETVQLRGTGSYCPSGSVTGYRWRVVRRPEYSTSRIEPSEEAAEASFWLDLGGLYVFELEVTSNMGDTSHPNCQVVVDTNGCGEDVHVQLVSDTPADRDQTDHGPAAGADLDLHLLREPGEWCREPDDCYMRNPNPDWGRPDEVADDPTLDIDDVDGAGPESANLNHPEDGATYRVGVHYFDDHGFGETFATVRIYIQDVTHFEATSERLAGTGAFWDVATIAWPAGHITPIDEITDAPPAACE